MVTEQDFKFQNFTKWDFFLLTVWRNRCCCHNWRMSYWIRDWKINIQIIEWSMWTLRGFNGALRVLKIDKFYFSWSQHFEITYLNIGVDYNLDFFLTDKVLRQIFLKSGYLRVFSQFIHKNMDRNEWQEKILIFSLFSSCT